MVRTRRRYPQVLKSFNDQFSAVVGQRIFESFTFDEGSYPLTGVKAAVEGVPEWAKGAPRQDDHSHFTFRCVLLVTDGASRENSPETRHELKRFLLERNITLAAVHILNSSAPEHAADIATFLKDLTSGLHCVLSAGHAGHRLQAAGDQAAEAGDLLTVMPNLLRQVFERMVSNLKAARTVPDTEAVSGGGAGPPPVEPACFPVIAASGGAGAGAGAVVGVGVGGGGTAGTGTGTGPTTGHGRQHGRDGPVSSITPRSIVGLYPISEHGKFSTLNFEDGEQMSGHRPSVLYTFSLPVTHSRERATAVVADPAVLEARRALVASARERTVALYHEVASSSSCASALVAAASSWGEAVKELRPLVSACVDVFADVVFPFNKYTRRRADLRGSQLYLPGLIKAVSAGGW